MQNDTCYILALIKRDDGQRLLLGSGYYEFTKDQKHFNPNLFANDIVELQGADGQLLAGQVRRSTAQSFDGYIGDGTTAKTIVEQKRREFFLFFRKQHHYTVVYIMPDGTAIKRDRGYIVDAPAVQELYQVQPKWHISLAFEDVNYYSYAEDEHGNETYSFEADLSLASVQGGGLKWDANGAISTVAGLGNIRISGDTFQQTYTGKNIYGIAADSVRGVDRTINDDGTFNLRGTVSGGGCYIITYVPIDRMENGATYTWWTNQASLPADVCFRLALSDGTTWVRNCALEMSSTNGTAARTFTANTSGSVNQIRCEIYIKNGTAVDISNIQIQCEKSASATTYEPYVGGVPSPNPDFPQTIQTVTGQQTIAINGTSYTVDLGATELCKLGTYQDYIWKDGDDWKVHKATNKAILDGSESWLSGGVTNVQYTTKITDYATSGNVPFSASFAGITNVSGASAVTGDNTIAFINRNDIYRFYIKSAGVASSQTAVKNWLSNHNTTVYYALATPTDTAITDAALIAQLEAVAEAMAEDGKPSSVTPTGTNRAAIITGDLNGVGGYEWEAAAGGGPSHITVNGVDDAMPVWYVTGPCANPTLTNSTTGISITWTGTVPSGQTLIVDMGAQTATMEGANVFQFISGSWLTLSPGTNRIAYTAANTTAGCKLYWNEIVG